LFEEEKAWLRQPVGEQALDTRHLGNTPVQGLAARPIIDI